MPAKSRNFDASQPVFQRDIFGCQTAMYNPLLMSSRQSRRRLPPDSSNFCRTGVRAIGKMVGQRLAYAILLELANNRIRFVSCENGHDVRIADRRDRLSSLQEISPCFAICREFPLQDRRRHNPALFRI